MTNSIAETLAKVMDERSALMIQCHQLKAELTQCRRVGCEMAAQLGQLEERLRQQAKLLAPRT